MGCLELQWTGVTLCCGAWISYHCGFSCWRAQALGAWALVGAACWLSSLWPVALQHVESSQSRDQTYVSCIDKWTLIHHQGRLLTPSLTTISYSSAMSFLGVDNRGEFPKGCNSWSSLWIAWSLIKQPHCLKMWLHTAFAQNASCLLSTILNTFWKC